LRVILDEDIPRELTAEFAASGHVVTHVEDLGFKGLRNSDLLKAISGHTDVFVTGDTNLGYQQDVRRLDFSIMLIHPTRLVIGQIRALIPEAVSAFEAARPGEVTTIGLPVRRKGR
jgi:predicted nuclease of predicted toxin-antitoxin system